MFSGAFCQIFIFGLAYRPNLLGRNFCGVRFFTQINWQLFVILFFASEYSGLSPSDIGWLRGKRLTDMARGLGFAAAHCIPTFTVRSFLYCPPGLNAETETVC